MGLCRLLLLPIIAATINSAAAAEITIRFPIEYAADIAPGVANREFKELVEQQTNGRVEVKLFPSGSLYKGLDLVQAILRGDAEMSTLTSAYWTALSPKLSVFELPYAFPERSAFYRAIDDAGFMESAYSDVEQKGAKIIAVLPYDHFGFATRTKALRAPRDMAGLKMRGLGRTNSAILSSLGASPVSLNLVELSPALQQGVIDGLNAPIDIMLAYKWYESVKHITYAPAYLGFYPWMANAKWWSGLPPDLRKIIQETAIEVALRHRARSEAETDKAIEALRRHGVDVHVQTSEERGAWAEATSSVWKQAEPQIGAELIARVRAYSK
ncbi:C4-dicarboxylate-binding periplasmic protein precursor [Variibacter gotjawalensis]|uniref:C4-dicarboxylate-binding periplasmic protein n=1 Tax=Variibacter gotjawalensis TaxID=1333996 RepID=A0A0S3PRL2_9BRAD|nr:TRAP transporter substrate-binding protein DctP [Variibacter gotjawalensis]NIK48909.1 C4-dicarboxylate-binding protein DctP [Variibacter gotjawalensis]RZS50765.1 C4-dicarboxylate-binding protein DctP [Variibacter gotjawalensis]BAT58599.1 C4-dicarboxylate-binding periplasmic protein precursor [Variibacter gotjawalensis]